MDGGATPAGLPSIRYYVCVVLLSDWIAAPGWQITQLTTRRSTTGLSIIQEAVESATLALSLPLFLPLPDIIGFLTLFLFFLTLGNCSLFFDTLTPKFNDLSPRLSCGSTQMRL